MSVVNFGRSTYLGFSGNGCVDFLAAFNEKAVSEGSPSRAVRCEVDVILGAGSTLNYEIFDLGTGLTNQASVVVVNVDSYKRIQGEWAYNALLSMSIDEALVISTGVALLWALAWGIRQLARAR